MIKMNRKLTSKYFLMIVGGKILLILMLRRDTYITFQSQQRYDQPSFEVYRHFKNENENQILKQREVNKHRIRHVERVCSDRQVQKLMPNLASSGNIWTINGVSHCIVPKAGSTFWKQVMRYLSGDFDDVSVSKPSDIDRYYTQYGIVKNIEVTSAANVSNDMTIYQGRGRRRHVMFARNPYARLWSTFIDKFFLPDFWASQSIVVAKFLRPNTNYSDLNCVSDVSFEEFLTYLTVTVVDQMNEHWKPIHRICNPCHVTFGIIGKHETLRSDTALIMEEYGIHAGDILESNVRETEMLIQYNFDLFYRRHELLKDCFDWLDIARRLWFAFQAGGFIHLDQVFPESTLLQRGLRSSPIVVFNAEVNRALDIQTDQMKKDLSAQKHNVILKAFERIPSPVMKLLKEIYYFDFVLFQYDANLVNSYFKLN